MRNVVVIVAVFAAVALSAVVKRQAATSYTLPDGADLVLGAINTGFSCEGRIYGYYADQGNDCRIFHVCVPDAFPDGTNQIRMYSFFCGNQTVFDQAQLACAHPQDATPCDQSQNYYSVNENFGKTDRPIQRA